MTANTAKIYNVFQAEKYKMKLKSQVWSMRKYIIEQNVIEENEVIKRIPVYVCAYIYGVCVYEPHMPTHMLITSMCM